MRLSEEQQKDWWRRLAIKRGQEIIKLHDELRQAQVSSPFIECECGRRFYLPRTSERVNDEVESGG